MNNKRNVLIGVNLVMASTLQPLAAQEIVCGNDETLVPLAGEIFNNAVQPGLTLGTLNLKFDKQTISKKKLTCGLMGQGGPAPDGSINFVHTFVCDDQVIFPLTGDTIHSQLSLNTTGGAEVQACPPGFPENSIFGTFQETSIPIPGTGRGVFEGVTTGEVHIEGTINCLAAIDMTFSGEVCLKTSPFGN